MTIELPQDIVRRIEAYVDRGDFQSPAEVIEAGLKLLEARPATLLDALTNLRQLVQVGIDEADRGALIDGDRVFGDWEKRLGGSSE
jgi:antitoxin ParD1/3/4